jgi:Tfp pilus assembly protein PilF
VGRRYREDHGADGRRALDGLARERKLGNREAEARYASQLRRRFPGSPEQELLSQGQYD